MEEAYRELYQQFLQLRSLCLRQAALLHQLTTDQQKQQGAADPYREMGSILVRCAPEFPGIFPEMPRPPTMAAQCGINHRPGNEAAPADLLAEDMSKLRMDLPLQGKGDGKTETRAAPLLTPDSSRWQGARSGGSRTPGDKTDRPGGDGTVRIPASQCPAMVVDFLSQPGSVLLSELMLQSHVCDFCQAVFPGDSTTKGEFLQHLHTHIT